jgi:hypothetical protein
MIEKATLFIGDERYTASRRIMSIWFTDENRGRLKDAIIKVQTSGVVELTPPA